MKIDRKKAIFLITFGTVLIIGLLFTATYAFIEDYVASTEAKNVIVEGSTVDDFKFESTGTLSLVASNENLTQNGNNLTSTLHAKALLKANSVTNTVTKNYYLYLVLANNNFVTIEEGYPEVILQVYNPNNTLVTSITGLTYNSTYQGFDITGVNGTFDIAINRSFTTTDSTDYEVEDWTFKTIYLNHNFNQIDNYGKILNASVHMSKNERS